MPGSNTTPRFVETRFTAKVAVWNSSWLREQAREAVFRDVRPDRCSATIVALGYENDCAGGEVGMTLYFICIWSSPQRFSFGAQFRLPRHLYKNLYLCVLSECVPLTSLYLRCSPIQRLLKQERDFLLMQSTHWRSCFKMKSSTHPEN
jgi:hypothetical protein